MIGDRFEFGGTQRDQELATMRTGGSSASLGRTTA
jgi:hypothetical protein